MQPPKIKFLLLCFEAALGKCPVQASSQVVRELLGLAPWRVHPHVTPCAAALDFNENDSHPLTQGATFREHWRGSGRDENAEMLSQNDFHQSLRWQKSVGIAVLTQKGSASKEMKANFLELLGSTSYVLLLLQDFKIHTHTQHHR
jgi:hypothetical protein